MERIWATGKWWKDKERPIKLEIKNKTPGNNKSVLGLFLESVMMIEDLDYYKKKKIVASTVWELAFING